MNRLVLLSVAACLIYPFAASAADDYCKFGADRSGTIAAAGATKIVVTSGGGDLTVTGEDGLASVEAKGRACASNNDLLQQVQLQTSREGDTIYVKSVYPAEKGGVFGFVRSATLDLTVRVPKSAQLSIEDSSGDLRVRDVRSAVIADSSGDQKLENIAGDLDVTDSSGDIDIASVVGNLKLKDSSGDVRVREVKGNIEVTVDSSGDLRFERVGGGVHILSDSSGEIFVREVEHDVQIDVDSSGDIDVDRIGGSFEVGADASGDIHYKNVLGNVKVPRKHDD
jgi:DUF4097 and DUF4098 domain-containing protein YvlB